jgi:hypothetical protein
MKLAAVILSAVFALSACAIEKTAPMAVSDATSLTPPGVCPVPGQYRTVTNSPCSSEAQRIGPGPNGPKIGQF